MKIKINLLENNSIQDAIEKLNNYKNSLTLKQAMFLNDLSAIGMNIAQIKFFNAKYDGTNDVRVYYNSTLDNAIITAEGKAVAFIEFGSGITYQEPYGIQKPIGIVGIGEYGHGYGKRKGWTYIGDIGTNGKTLLNGRVFTRGNPPAKAMLSARGEMLTKILEVARRYYSDR